MWKSKNTIGLLEGTASQTIETALQSWSRGQHYSVTQTIIGAVDWSAWAEQRTLAKIKTTSRLLYVIRLHAMLHTDLHKDDMAS